MRVMEDNELLDLARRITATHEVHANNEAGDKYLSDPNLYAEIMGELLLGNPYDALRKARKDGWLT